MLLLFYCKGKRKESAKHETWFDFKRKKKKEEAFLMMGQINEIFTMTLITYCNKIVYIFKVCLVQMKLEEVWL